MVAGLTTLAAVVTAFQLDRIRYEEPAYDKLAEHGEFEVRQYGPRVVAETVVEGDGDEATREGFRRLAGYIFGGNDGGASIAMTTPVERAPEGSRIAMTTPVERTTRDGSWVVTFTMPSEYRLDELPTPDDARVVLRRVQGPPVAVLRFSGRADDSAKRERADALRALLERSGYEPAGEATLAQYDPPWVLGLFRRNEVMIPVRERG